MGHLPRFARDPLRGLEHFARLAGDRYRLRLGRETWWVIHDPGDLERIFTAARSFIKDRDTRNATSLFGDGLLTSAGETWRRQRRLIQPAFHRDDILGYAPRMVALAEEAAATLVDGEVVDVHAHMMDLTLRIAAESLFGDGQVRSTVVGPILEALLRRFEGMVGWLAPEWFLMLPGSPYRRAILHLDAIVDELVQRRLAQPGAPANDLLARLVAAVDEDGHGMSPRQLRDEIVTLLLAGHETTANALTWTWHLLGLHPEVEQRIFDEVAALPEPLGAADIPRLPYTSAVLQESMRLYPPAWLLGREALEDFPLSQTTIPRGAQILMSSWVVHRDPRFWSDPLAFAPERWLAAGAKRPPYAYFPFGGGQRMCIGKGFAMLESVLLLATLVRRVRWLPTGRPVRERASITLRPDGGLPMRVAQRRQAHGSRVRSANAAQAGGAPSSNTVASSSDENACLPDAAQGAVARCPVTGSSNAHSTSSTRKASKP